MNKKIIAVLIGLYVGSLAASLNNPPAAAGAGAAAGASTQACAGLSSMQQVVQAAAPIKTSQELYADRVQLKKQVRKDALLAHLAVQSLCEDTVQYLGTIDVIKDKDDFGDHIGLCTDDCDELDAIKEYIDRDPAMHIDQRFGYWEMRTPLFTAMTINNDFKNHFVRPGLMRLLLSYPQDLNAKGCSIIRNNTALHACVNTHVVPIEYLILLVEYGADFNTKNTQHHNETAEEHALEKKNTQSYMFLKYAREFDEQLKQTMPDVLKRRKVVADQLRMLQDITESAMLTKEEAHPDPNHTSWYTVNWHKGILQAVWDTLTQARMRAFIDETALQKTIPACESATK